MKDIFETALQLRNQGLSATCKRTERELFEAALPLFEEAATEKPNDAERFFYLAMAHDLLDHETEAIPQYHHAIALGLPLSQRFEAYLYLASSYYNTGMLVEAESALEEAERLLRVDGATDESGSFAGIANKIRQKRLESRSL